MWGFSIQTVLVYYAFLLPAIFGFYIYSIAILFKTMNHKQLVTPLDDEVKEDYVLEELFQFHDD